MLEGYSSARRPVDPFREMRRAQADLNQIFGGLRFVPRSEFPALNVWANSEAAIITAQVPGVSPEQLDVAVHQDTVTLRGARDAEAAGDEAVTLRLERPDGAFTRNVVLPFRVDPDRVSARFDRGVLTCHLPRPEEDKPRQIKVTRA